MGERTQRAVIWATLLLFAFQAASYAVPYVTGDPAGFDPLFRDKYTRHLGLIVVHGLTASLALCLGPFQFWPWLRHKLPRLHRWLGQAYLLAVVGAATTALPMALMAEGGAVAKLSFLALAMAWLATAWQALRQARLRHFAAHRAWMVRNYALTYGAVIFRLLLNGLQEAGLEFDLIYPVLSWSGWLVSLLTAELWLRKEHS